MYNRDTINRLISYIQKLNGIGDKEKLSSLVKKEFNLVQDRKVFYSPDFAIRFSKSKRKRMSNTVYHYLHCKNMTTNLLSFV